MTRWPRRLQRSVISIMTTMLAAGTRVTRPRAGRLPGPSSARRPSALGPMPTGAVGGSVAVVSVRAVIAVAVAAVAVAVSFTLVVGLPQATPWVMGVLFTVVAATIVVAWWEVRRVRETYRARLSAQAAEAGLAQLRLDIARDLHDIVSHGMGTVTTRAASALRVDGEDPALLRRALHDVEETSRAATTELRRMMHALRGDAAPLAPAPGLGQLDDLVAASTTLRVRVVRSGDVDDLSDGVSLVAYRVIQEALANTARHAGPTDVTVSVARTDDSVDITVTDDGAAPGWVTVPGSGYGLLGLRERVASVGGTVDLHTSDRGSSLLARLPEVSRG